MRSYQAAVCILIAGSAAAAPRPTAPAEAAQLPTFSTRMEAVRVDALVTENGRPLRGLRRDDFEIRDNGVPQQLTLISSEQLPLNIVLALDASHSVAGEPLQHLKAAGGSVIRVLENRDRIALLTFNHSLHLEAPLTNDITRVEKAIDRIEASGNTALFDATYTAMSMAETGVGRGLSIVFTDGSDTASYLGQEAVIDAARDTEVVTYGVVVATRGRPPFLNEFIERTGGRVLELQSIRDLPGAFLRILEEFRLRYLLSYSPRDVPKTGWHRIEVRVRNRHVSVKARPGYQAGQ